MFNEDDEEVLNTQEAEQARPERASEIKPVHHKQGQQHGVADEGESADDDDEVGSSLFLYLCHSLIV